MFQSTNQFMMGFPMDVSLPEGMSWPRSPSRSLLFLVKHLFWQREILTEKLTAQDIFRAGFKEFE